MKGVKVFAGEAARERGWDKASALWSRRWEVKVERRGGCAAAAVSRAVGFTIRRSPSFVLAADRGEDIDGILKDWSSRSRG